MKLADTERVLAVPIDTELVEKVRKEAKRNGLQLREAVLDALELWLVSATYLRETEELRLERRRARREI